MKERIDSLISPKVLDEFDQLNNKLGTSITNFEVLIAEAVKVNKAFGGTSTFKQVTQETKNLEAAEKSLLDQKNEVAKAQKKLDDLYSAEARRLAEIKEQTLLVNKANKLSAQETLGLVDAYKRLEIESNLASRAARNLAVQHGVGSKEAKAATARALELETRLKAADASVGRFQRNVGNYSGALATLKDAFADVSSKLDAFKKSGDQSADVLQALQKEYDLLNKLVNSQEAGFANATQEIRANQKALMDLENAGLGSSQAFAQLALQTGELKDQVGDLATRTKNLGSDTFVFDGLIGAAEGLAGVYGIAQGAAALFGEENEELQKTFVKLQAIMTILQSLQAVRVAMQREEAAALLLNNVITNVRMATESKYIVVRYAAIAAQKLLNFAMSAAGGPILAAVAAIALILISLKTFASSTNTAKKSLEDYNREMENGIEIANRYDEGLKKLNEIRIEEAKLAGKSEQQLRELRVEGMREQLKLQEELEAKSIAGYDAALKARERNAKGLIELSEEENEVVQNNIKNFESISKRRLDLEDEIRLEELRNRNATKQEIEQFNKEAEQRQRELTDLTRTAGMERIRATTEIYKLEQRNIADNQRKISEIEFLQVSKRTEALKKSLEAERNIIIADREQRISDEMTNLQRNKANANGSGAEIALQEQISAEKIKLIRAQTANDLTRVERELSMQILVIQHKANKDRGDLLKADIEMTKDHFAKQKELQLKAIEDSKVNAESELETRVNHLTIYRDSMLKAYEQERNDKIKAAGGQAERQKIEEVYQKKRLQVELDTNILILQATLETQQRLLTFITDPKLKAALEAKIAELKLQLEGLRGQSVDIKVNADVRDLEKIEAAFNKIKEVAGSVLGVIGGAISSSIDKQKNALREQTDEVERSAEQQIEAINATAESEEKKAARIAIVNARAAAQKQELDRQQRVLDQRKAEYEKARTIAEIILNTAIAVVKGLKDGGPFAAVLYGALGAAQLAVAMSTEIPKFKHGTLDAPGGPAIVGDGYKSELMVTPDGKLVETPAIPTVMNVPKHSIIYPDAKQARAELERRSTTGAPRLVDHKRYMKEMTGTIGGKIDNLTNVVRNKTENHWYPKKDGWERLKDNRINYL